MVVSDNISVYDIVLNGTVLDKGAILNAIPVWWSRQTGFPCSHDLYAYGFKNFSDCFGQYLTSAELKDLTARGTLIRRHKPILVEAVVRGYLTGSGWKNYKKNDRRTVYGNRVPNNLQDGSRLEEPIWTPTTKATEGHDEEVGHDQLCSQMGTEEANRLRDASVGLYNWSLALAHDKGLILADTKYEWAFDPNGELILIDEWNTPDSSRFWLVSEWQEALAAGRTPPSHDKQGSRDWADGVGIDNLSSLVLADTADGREMLVDTNRRYHEIFRLLTDQRLWDFHKETLGIPLAT